MYRKQTSERASALSYKNGHLPIEIKAAAECRIDAINLGYIITYDQSKQFRFTDTLTRHFNPTPGSVWCPQFKSKQKHKLTSYARVTAVQTLRTEWERDTHTHTFYGTYVVFTHITQQHNGHTLPSSHSLQSPATSLSFYTWVSVSALDDGENVKHQLESAIGIETHKRTFCSEHSLLGRTQLLISAHMFVGSFLYCFFFFLVILLGIQVVSDLVSKWVCAIQFFHFYCLRFSHKRVYHIYSISAKKVQITDFFSLGWKSSFVFPLFFAFSFIFSS